MRPTPYVASLRVYQPLEAFTQSQQQRWVALRAQQAVDTHHNEQELALRRAIKPQPLGEDGAHFIPDGERLLVCPWSTPVRCWGAVAAFKDSLPPSVSRLFLPAGIDQIFPPIDEVPSIQTETWVVPPRWFALFEPSERTTGLTPNGDKWVRMRTSMANARKRSARTLQVVRSAFGEGAIAQENEELGQWLEEFHPHSLLELDYGGLASLVEEPDTSIEDVAQSLAGLARGDGIEAGVGYQRLMNRWRAVAIYEHAT